MRAAAVTALVALCLPCLDACGGSIPSYPWPKEPDPTRAEIELGVGDVVGITVWDNRDFNTDATVRADGTITIPLIGDLKAAGSTPSMLRKAIKDRVEQFIKFPEGQNFVTVMLKTWRSYRWTIQGEVTRQGVFTSDHYVRVSEAIAQAGGPSRFARRERLVLFRYDAATRQTKRIPLHYDLIVSGERPDMDIFVLANDVIYIP
ncbi:MAG: polysaccharide export protein [Deltaproteobacteria bacterium]|nr:polysaccharide export protein [Deltaproteobacteria bacterium]MCW5808102.1 polysaccharide export protein [Deltaproteobacteria bacterium]